MDKWSIVILLLFYFNFEGSCANLSSAQKKRAEQITSVFENDDIRLRYDSCENIGDGRGFTAGRAGFTTGTCDAIDVIEKYGRKKPNNGLAKYLSELRRLCSRNSDSTSKLVGYCEQWKQAARDAEFRKAQDQVVDELYYKPAMKWANRIGVTTPLTLAFLYDTIIQHGEGTDPDGFPALIKRATQRAGGDPKSGVDEKRKWTPAFIEERRKTLAHAHNTDTRVEWAKSVDRADFFKELVRKGSWDLKGPIRVKTIHHDIRVP